MPSSAKADARRLLEDCALRPEDFPEMPDMTLWTPIDVFVQSVSSCEAVAACKAALIAGGNKQPFAAFCKAALGSGGKASVLQVNKQGMVRLLDPEPSTPPCARAPAAKTEYFNGKETVRGLGAGDSFLIVDFMPSADADAAFQAVSGETPWGSFNIRGGAVPRDVCTMGVPQQSLAGGGGAAAAGVKTVRASLAWPLYRHPVDAHPAMHPWVPSVASIVSKAEEATGEIINHGLIQR
jgi:hypothetical protein